ncbi:hypothetical protein CANTEDRAFT_94135 [Yamadazyma tenuis ATCC 10573]|uniref:Cullin family profile domain-containing protein n=2 Tax=Candida tenuis TaxID=2315449 RepID=G3B641_CANTC|nr:uncharacterized protein CANTEDRAFT_94135 [Yamadazyma tenuis ATCC 10573]EGV63374.1 hypothetical protein CANTEDRAFT_94135 [Yamadazyma tenuis ATCC 10573]
MAISHNPVPSHLSQSRARSSSANKVSFKRLKTHSSKYRNEEHSLKQLEFSKALVHEAIDLVFNSEPLKYGYSFYYQKVEAICKYKHAEQSKLAEHLKGKIEDHFFSVVKPKVFELVHSHNLDVKQFISDLLKVYEKWESKLRLLGKLFLYLDRSYLLQHPNKKVILELGLELYVDNLLADPIEEGIITIDRYTSYLSQCLRSEVQEDLALAEVFSRMLIKLNFSQKIKLDNKIISSCLNLAKDLREVWSQDYDDYVHKTLKKISKIITFFKECGQPKDFCEKLLIQLKWVTIFFDFNEVISHCLPYMLSSENGLQLSMIYNFCELTPKEYSIDSIPIFVLHWGKIVSQQVQQEIDKESDISTGSVIVNLVKVYEKYRTVVETKFKKNEKFEFEIRHSFSRSINASRKTNSLIISHLCKYSDTFFKTKKAGITYDEFEAHFMVIFKFLNNKTDFIVNYKNQLSRRLLLSRNSSIVLEKKLVDSITSIVGENDDSIGLNVMFKDLAKSQEKYSHLKGLGNDSIEFNGLILEKKHWPEVPKQDSSVILPPSLSMLIESFNNLYKSSDEKLKNHSLDWGCYNLHQLLISCHFNGGAYELNVNLLQAIVILLFNDKDTITMDELIQQSNLDVKLLRRIILSLSDKYKILIEDGDLIRFNHSFTDKSKKLKIPLPRDRDIGSSTSNIPGDDKITTRNRDTEIRSVIVSIIKVDTKILFTDLINKAIETVSKKGPVSIQDIKSNIEFLITKEYITRDTDNVTLTYVP